MATFTMSLKEAIDRTGGTVDIVNGVAKITGGNIGLQYYPIFDETYRDPLTGRIIDHFWNREIGQESISMFQLAMRRRMNEIMPYYNKLYLSERIAYDPLSTISLHTVGSMSANTDSTSTADSSGTSTASGNSRTVNSETPQTMLEGNGDYATAGTDAVSSSGNSSTGTQSGEDTQTTDQDSDTTVSGYQGAASDLIMRYRESLLNIDLMVIGQLEDLFMLVWDNGDSYTNEMRGFLY